MAHEIVEIPITRGPPYEAVAVFMGTLAYPDYKAGRERLRKAWCREAVRSEAAWNPAFARGQYGRPQYMLMDERAARTALRAGATALGVRKAAAIATRALFDGTPIGGEIKALETTFENTAGGRAILTNAWLSNNDTGTKNVGSCKVKPSRRVLHAAHGYWLMALEARRWGRAADDREAEELIATCSLRFSRSQSVIAERCRRSPSSK